MVDAVGLPIVDYALAVKNHDRLLAQFQKTPSFSQAVAYYRKNIGKVASVDDLLNDRKLLTVALSAFQLEDEVDAKGLLRKLLSQDPNAKGSLAQQLIDPRFRAFAEAFSSLRSDGGAAVGDPNAVDAVIAGFQTNEFEKFLSNNSNDPALRQALFFQRTVEDTVNISAAGSLLSQFGQSPAVSQDVTYYKNNIGNVTTVAGLLGDQRLLKVALGAFGINPASVSTTTLNQILTEGPFSGDPLTKDDARFAAFVAAFGSLDSDGGKAIHQQGSIAAVTAGYQSNSLATAAASTDPTALASLGSSGSATVSRLLADFQRSSGTDQAVAYYQSAIGKVRNVSGLTADPQLLSVALTAFGLDPHAISPALAGQLLTQDPHAPVSLAAEAQALLQNDPAAAAFAKAFGSLASDGGFHIQQGGNVASVTAAFLGQSFRQSLLGKFQAASTPGAGQITTLQILSNPTLAAVTRGALGLPDAVGGLDVGMQVAAMTRAGFDPGKLTDPKFVGDFINRFLANAGTGQASGPDLSSPSGLALALLGGGSNGATAGLLDPTGGGANPAGPIGIDLSFLAGNQSSGLNLLV